MMKRYSLIMAAVACSLLGACQHAEIDHQPAGDDLLQEGIVDSPSTISGVVNVKFTPEMADFLSEALSGGEGLTKALENPKAEALKASMEELGITSITRVFPDAGKWEARHRAAGLHTWFRVTYSEELPHTKASASLSQIPGVAEIEVPRKIRKASAGIPFNDPENVKQWSLYNDGSKSKFEKGIDINVLPVWQNFTTGSSSVIVAVVDGGVDVNHPDLQGVVIPGGENGSKCFVYNYEGYDISADSHGTHVGGIIGAINNNAIGVSSVAGGSDGRGGVKLLSCQIFKDKLGVDGTYPGDAAAGIVWGADHGAVISQNSWTHVYETEAQAKKGIISSTVKAAVDYFIEYAGLDENGKQVGPMKGGVVFFAAGNDGFSIGWPGAYEPVVAVGAVGPDGKKATYSNYGSWVDICAPGGEANRFSFNTDAYILSTCEGGYKTKIGTSQACPHVSGVAALLLSYYGGPGFTNSQLKDMLLLGANYSAPSASEQIGPMLDAYGAFLTHNPAAPTIKSDHSGDVVLKSNESVTISYTITSALSAPVRSSVQSDCPAVSSEASADGLSLKMHIDATKAQPGTYEATVIAALSESCRSTETVKITIQPNHAPQKTSEAIPDIVVESKDETVTLDMTKYVIDEDGEDLKYMIDSSAPEKMSVKISGNSITFSPKAYGKSIFTITASDSHGEKVELAPFTFIVFDKESLDGFAAYPNPVVDVLKIHAGAQKEMSFKLANSNGVTLASGTVKGSVLAPAELNFSLLAPTPGRYSLTVTYDGQSYQKTIVKK